MDAIEFSDEEIETATNWHGGQSSMLYALCSTGSLARGTIRPMSYDHDGPMTDPEWLASLASDLEMEAERCARDAAKMARTCPRKERDNLRADRRNLLSIAATCAMAVRELQSE